MLSAAVAFYRVLEPKEENSGESPPSPTPKNTEQVLMGEGNRSDRCVSQSSSVNYLLVLSSLDYLLFSVAHKKLTRIVKGLYENTVFREETIH